MFAQTHKPEHGWNQNSRYVHDQTHFFMRQLSEVLHNERSNPCIINFAVYSLMMMGQQQELKNLLWSAVQINPTVQVLTGISMPSKSNTWLPKIEEYIQGAMMQCLGTPEPKALADGSGAEEVKE